MDGLGWLSIFALKEKLPLFELHHGDFDFRRDARSGGDGRGPLGDGWF